MMSDETTELHAICNEIQDDKKLITIALQLVRDHYCYTERFDESCIELERWCHDHGETDLMEYAMALRCPACAFVPMDDVEDGQSAKLTAEQVREAIRKYAEDDSCYIFEVYGEMCGPIADELNAATGGGTCKITATSTNNLMYPDYMVKWYELSCGHSLTLKGEEVPKWCAVCGKAVSA